MLPGNSVIVSNTVVKMYKVKSPLCLETQLIEQSAAWQLLNTVFPLFSHTVSSSAYVPE